MRKVFHVLFLMHFTSPEMCRPTRYINYLKKWKTNKKIKLKTPKVNKRSISVVNEKQLVTTFTKTIA